MIFSKKISLVLLTLIFLSCTQKGVILYVPSDIQTRIADANQSLCSYKGRVSVLYKTPAEDVRFKGYLNKDCSDNFKLKILGLFNSVAYDISFQDGVVQAYEKGEDVSDEIAYFMHSKGLDTMVSLIRYPHVKVDETFKAKAEDDEYILSKGSVTVSAGADLLIRKISTEGGVIEYSYDGGGLSGLYYTMGETKAEIRLR